MADQLSSQLSECKMADQPPNEPSDYSPPVNSVPREILLMIFECVVATASSTDKKGAQIKKLRLVCRAWSDFVDRMFTTFEVRPGSLGNFEGYYAGNVDRQAWLEKIRMHINPYDDSFKEGIPVHNMLTDIYNKALRDLFHILGTWNMNELMARKKAEKREDISLELVVCLPRHARMYRRSFMDWGLLDLVMVLDRHSEHPGKGVITSFSVRRDQVILSDRAHHWNHGQSFGIETISETSEEPKPSYTSKSYPSNPEYHDQWDKCFTGRHSLWPKSLKQVHIFHDRSASDHPTKEIVRTDKTKTQAQRIIYESSAQLEDLSICNLIDAEEFFWPFLEIDAFTPASIVNNLPRWEQLHSLTLTSDLIQEQDKWKVMHLLRAAGEAAKRMPALALMELFNTNFGPNTAGVFLYEVNEEGANVKWASTWELKLDSSVGEVWQRVGPEGRKFEVLPEQVLERGRDHSWLLR